MITWRSYEELKNKQKFQHPKTPETDEQSAAERPAGTLSYKSHATAGTWPRDVAFLTQGDYSRARHFWQCRQG